MNNITCVVHAMNDAPEDRAKCGRCERDVGAIFCCSERLLGHCPFVEQKWGRYGCIAPIVFLVFGVCLLVIGVTSGTSAWAWAWGIALVCVVSALILLAITREKLLYNTHSQVLLRRTTVAGIELSYQWNWDVGLPRVHLEPTQPLTYPLSIASLEDIRANVAQAVTIIRAALIDLLAKQYIEACLFRTYAITRIRPRPRVIDSCVVLVGRHTEGFENLGELEKRIFLAVTHRSTQSASKDATEGLRLYDVVRAVYEQDQPNPPAWLAELVARDAVKRGLGQIKGMWFLKIIEWNATHLPRLEDDASIAQSLSKQLAETYPEFSHLLDTQISKAISAMTSGE